MSGGAGLSLGAAVVQCEARVASVPLAPRIVTAHYTIPSIEMVVLRVRDADGQEGMASLWCFGAPQARVLVSMLDVLAPLVRRAGAVPVAAVSAAIRAEINFLGYKGVSVFALSAFDMALHDLACRRRDVALGALLGRRRDAVPAYWSGLFLNQTEAELCAEVDERLGDGFRAFKLRTGKVDLAEDVARAEAVAALLPDDAVLMIDAVQSWDVETTIAAADRLADLAPRWLEDPLVHCDYAGLDEVVRRSPIPIATGENEYLSDGFEAIFASGARYLLADLERVGGITEWLVVAERARERGHVLTPHVYPHVAVQLCSALEQDEVWVEYVPWWNALLSRPLELVDGAVRVPDAPGTGFDVDPAALDAHSLTPWFPLAMEDS